MIERETGWKRERKIERQSRWEKERATEGKRERKTKVGETEKKKEWQTVWTVGERELQIER